MNSKERLLRTLSFQSVDRVPLVEWGVREATMREWIKQGYPKGTPTSDFFSLDTFHLGVPINLGMYPAFEEEIIEKGDRYQIWRDNLGAIRKDFSTIENPGFVTRKWISFAVTDRASFLEMKKRYIASDEGRMAENAKKRGEILRNADVATHLSIPFLFWQVRDWVGFENLCMMFYDDPKLVHEMMEFLTDFIIETLTPRIDLFPIDLVEFKEDMAYKGAPMISPQMFREFMYPHYVRLIDFLRAHGAKHVYVDCDGYPGGLIPEYIDAGVDGMSPVEIAAGNDLIKLRKEYPTFAMMGGVDKRALARDKKTIYNEVMSKIPHMIEKGGFVPHIDHAIPHDVPLANYQYYRDILTRVVYGESVPEPK
ncbi:MAG: hypothetical protein E7334_02320 [Clostridiales bacterium]|nr:hypothetical protein [Clostridiales bacterium]